MDEPRKNEPRKMDTWCSGREREFKVRAGAPLQEILQAAKEGLPKHLRELVVGKPVRSMCPKCFSRGEEYIVWEWRGKGGVVVKEFHLFKTVEYDGNGYAIKWEII